MKRIFLLTLGLCSCVGSGQDHPEVLEEAVESPVPSDSLVLRAGAFEVWFTDARPMVSDSGEPCMERALEIRQGTARRHIPLLYSLEAPTPLDDTTMRAILYNNCRPVGAYRVDYATASPHRLEGQ